MKRTIIYIDNFLTEHGHTPTTGIGLVNLFKEEGYNVVACSSKKNKVLRMADMLSAIFNNRENAIVIIATYSTSAFYFAWSCAKLCQFLKLPYITCLHGGNLPDRIIQSPAKCKDLFGKSFCNVAVSKYLGNKMEANGWPWTEVPNFIHLEHYPFKHRLKAAPRLLWVRSFHEIYNPQLAIYIVHQILQKFPDLTLTMAGPAKDDSLEKCQQLVKTLKLEANISFTGLLPRKDWVALSSAHDFFINTTNFDNLPVSVIEAMALGMVVISTNVGGMPFLINDGVDGILVPKENAGAFAAIIEKLLNEQSFAASLSEAARTTALKFDYTIIQKKWANLLASVPE